VTPFDDLTELTEIDLNDPNANPDQLRVAATIHAISLMIVDRALNLSDTECFNVAFGVYVNMILRCLETLEERMALGDTKAEGLRESLRDGSLIQVQKYVDLLMQRYPRMGRVN